MRFFFLPLITLSSCATLTLNGFIIYCGSGPETPDTIFFYLFWNTNVLTQCVDTFWRIFKGQRSVLFLSYRLHLSEPNWSPGYTGCYCNVCVPPSSLSVSVCVCVWGSVVVVSPEYKHFLVLLVLSTLNLRAAYKQLRASHQAPAERLPPHLATVPRVS